jgi:hypothetical protein
MLDGGVLLEMDFCLFSGEGILVVVVDGVVNLYFFAKIEHD